MDLFDFDTKSVFTRLALHHLNQAGAVNDPQLPFERTIFQLEEDILCPERDFRDIFGSLWPLVQDVFVRAGLESVVELQDGLEGIDKVVCDFIHDQLVRYGHSDGLRDNVEHAVLAKTTSGKHMP